MYRYILKRLILLIPVLLGVSMLVYCILDLTPGDAADILAPDDATLEEKEALREEMGLNRPVLVRYAEYMWNLLHGDLGESYLSPVSVWDAFLQKAPKTLLLGFASVVVSVGLSLPLGIYAAQHRGSWKDALSMILAILGLSMPNFWLGLLLMLLFALKLGWLPSGGADQGFLSLILPAITIGTGMMATLTRTTRSSMLDVIRQDYLRTARAKGVPEKVVIRKHALKNALIPIITIIGTQ
ncbi:MAG: ABC transporter permease, partial [Firmicutes bacterium]|nr:ABC transporter permease [Bacillota bacterium]